MASLGVLVLIGHMTTAEVALYVWTCCDEILFNLCKTQELCIQLYFLCCQTHANSKELA